MKYLIVLIIFGMLYSKSNTKLSLLQDKGNLYDKKNYFFLKKDSIYGYEFAKIYLNKKDSTIKFIELFPDSNYKFPFASHFSIKNKLNGPSTYYFIPNSNQITSTAFYKDGKLNGETKTFDFNGKLISVEIYRNGKLVSKN